MQLKTHLPLELYSLFSENTEDTLQRSISTLTNAAITHLLDPEQPATFRQDFPAFDEAMRNSHLSAWSRVKFRGVMSAIKALSDPILRPSDQVRAALQKAFNAQPDRAPLDALAFIMQEISSLDATKDFHQSLRQSVNEDQAKH